MNFKKVLLIVMLLVLPFAVFCCTDDNSESSELLDSIMKGVIVDKSYKNLSGDLSLPDTAGGQYFIEWSIDSEYSENAVIAISNDGFPYIDVTQSDKVVKFILTGKISDENGNTASREWECWIKASTVATKVTCLEAIDEANDNLLQITGTVSYVINSKGFFVQDDTGSIYVYVNGAISVKVGDTVTVKGTKSKNYDMHQLTSPVIVNSESGTFDVSKASTNATIFELDAMLEKFYSSSSAEYLKSVVSKFGTFYNVEGYLKANPDSSISKYVIEDA